MKEVTQEIYDSIQEKIDEKNDYLKRNKRGFTLSFLYKFDELNEYDFTHDELLSLPVIDVYSHPNFDAIKYLSNIDNLSRKKALSFYSERQKDNIIFSLLQINEK